MRRLKRLISDVLAVLLMVQATGCTSWRTVSQPWPLAFDSSRAKPKIQVVLVNGAKFKADSSGVGPETLLAYRDAMTDTIPLSRVAKIQTRHFALGKTALLAIVLALPVLFLYAVGEGNREY